MDNPIQKQLFDFEILRDSMRKTSDPSLMLFLISNSTIKSFEGFPKTKKLGQFCYNGIEYQQNPRKTKKPSGWKLKYPLRDKHNGTPLKIVSESIEELTEAIILTKRRLQINDI